MKHLFAVNQKARMIEGIVIQKAQQAHAMMAPDPPFGCTTMFSPGWEVDSSGGTHGLCTPSERDLYDCYHTCYWPAQVPDALTNSPHIIKFIKRFLFSCFFST